MKLLPFLMLILVSCHYRQFEYDSIMLSCKKIAYKTNLEQLLSDMYVQYGDDINNKSISMYRDYLRYKCFHDKLRELERK